MPEYLYKIQPTRLEMLTEGSTEREAEIVSQHFQYLSDLTDQGVVIMVGRTQNNDASTFGIVIFEAEDEDAARQIMNNDPAVQNGVMRAELYLYKVALMRKVQHE
jgi:uncharacterized protein